MVETRVPEDIVFGKRGVQSRDEFVKTQEEAQDRLSGEFAIKLNTMSEEINNTADDINDDKNKTKTYRDEAYGYKKEAYDSKTEAIDAKNSAVQAKNEAILAKDEIEKYVIPEDATLSEDAINKLVENAKKDHFFDLLF